MDIDTLAQQAGDVTDPTHDQLLTGRRRLDEATDRAGARVTALHRSRRTNRGPRRRWAATALTAAAASAAVAVAVPLAGAPSASAEEVLLVTAESAGEQPDQTAGATHWYVASEADHPDTKPYESEVWYGRDEPTIRRDGAAAAGMGNEGVQDLSKLRTEEAVGEDGITSSTWYIGGDSTLTWDDLEELPTDPADLETLLRAGAAGAEAGEDNELWSTIQDLLRSPASPALRQALWEVAAHMPDVELVGPMTDAAGRQGTAIERDQTDQGWYDEIYVLDPDTGALLENQVLDEDGTVVYRQTDLVQEPRDTAPEPDAPFCGPGSQPERSC